MRPYLGCGSKVADILLSSVRDRWRDSFMRPGGACSLESKGLQTSFPLENFEPYAYQEVQSTQSPLLLICICWRCWGVSSTLLHCVCPPLLTHIIYKCSRSWTIPAPFWSTDSISDSLSHCLCMLCFTATTKQMLVSEEFWLSWNISSFVFTTLFSYSQKHKKEICGYYLVNA